MLQVGYLQRLYRDAWSTEHKIGMLRQIHIQFSSTCTVMLTNTCTVLSMHVCFAKVQIENRHKCNVNIIEAVKCCTILLCFNLKDTILVMATFIFVYSDKFSVSICISQGHMCRRSRSCREDTVFLHIYLLEYGLHKGFCILV